MIQVINESVTCLPESPLGLLVRQLIKGLGRLLPQESLVVVLRIVLILVSIVVIFIRQLLGSTFICI